MSDNLNLNTADGSTSGASEYASIGATGPADVGVVGMGVMGRNLARNFASRGFTVALFNRTGERTEEVMAAYGDEGAFFATGDPGTDEVQALLTQRGLTAPGVGKVRVTAVHDDVAGLQVRQQRFDGRVGAGISGGEEGALLGPAIMPGGPEESYQEVGPLFEAIAAKVDGEPCCTHVGPDGAGHFVKMVHNGIEYSDMQLIAEAYDLLRQGLGATPAEIAEIFAGWNEGDLESFLIEITAEVLGHVDAETGRPFIDVVVDEAGQKGTGRWTVQNALDLGVPITGIAEATFARALSSSLPQRQAARGVLAGHAQPWAIEDREAFIEDIRQALYASKVVAYSQGFDQIAAASAEYDWNIDRAGVARIWRGGCIIRARFLNRIAEAYGRDRELPLLLADPHFAQVLDEPTASLDARNEAALQAAVDAVAADRTLVVVAHRLSTVVRADQIVVLEAGEVVAVGAHDDLVRDSDLYRELAATQLLV